jgi:hypothetical protein
MSDDLEPVTERAIFLEIDTLTESVGDYLCAISARVAVRLDL